MVENADSGVVEQEPERLPLTVRPLGALAIRGNKELGFSAVAAEALFELDFVSRGGGIYQTPAARRQTVVRVNHAVWHYGATTAGQAFDTAVQAGHILLPPVEAPANLPECTPEMEALLQDIASGQTRLEVIRKHGHDALDALRGVLGAPNALVSILRRSYEVGWRHTPWRESSRALAQFSIVTANRISLAKRQLQVLQLKAEGLSNPEVGERLSIGSETVKTHLQRSAERLGTSNTIRQVTKAAVLGLLVPTGEAPPLTHPLTERELWVMVGVAQGKTSAEIGERLHLSPKTISDSMQGAVRKLGVRHRIHAVWRMFELGLAQGVVVPPRPRQHSADML